MTNEQIAWAAQHDWFITRHYIKTDTVVVKDKSVKEGYRKFNDYQELRKWAGY